MAWFKFCTRLLRNWPEIISPSFIGVLSSSVGKHLAEWRIVRIFLFYRCHGWKGESGSLSQTDAAARFDSPFLGLPVNNFAQKLRFESGDVNLRRICVSRSDTFSSRLVLSIGFSVCLQEFYKSFGEGREAYFYVFVPVYMFINRLRWPKWNSRRMGLVNQPRLFVAVRIYVTRHEFNIEFTGSKLPQMLAISRWHCQTR